MSGKHLTRYQQHADRMLVSRILQVPFGNFRHGNADTVTTNPEPVTLDLVSEHLLSR